jgi:hypothetical protein
MGQPRIGQDEQPLPDRLTSRRRSVPQLSDMHNSPGMLRKSVPYAFMLAR